MCTALSATTQVMSLFGIPFCYLREAPPFATAHTFCAFQDGTRNLDFLRTVPTNSMVCLRSL